MTAMIDGQPMRNVKTMVAAVTIPVTRLRACRP
jgi:hypothetical protein